MTTRRTVLAAGILAACALALAGCKGGARSASERPDDRAMGDPNAPVVIIEYASVMCPHCQHFHLETLPELKARYIDTGKVRFIFRELPTAPVPLAMGGFLLARCADENKYFPIIDTLFHQREAILAAARSPTGAKPTYQRIARAVGISDDELDVCLRDEDEVLRIRDVADEAEAKYGVSSTPSFIINGKLYVAARSIDEFAAIIDPLLGEEAPADEGGASGES